MAFNLKFSPLNPIQFHRAANGCYWVDDKPAHEQTMKFSNPWKTGDTFRFQIEINALYYSMGQVSITLRTCGTGVLVANFSTINAVYNPANATYILTFSKVLISAGDQYIHVRLLHGSTYENFYSEPISIKSAQDGTVLFAYSSYGIIKDTWFIDSSGHEIIYYYRCFGGIQTKDRMPGCDSNIYVDQAHTFDTISSREFDTYKLTIGNNYGLPYPYVSLINRILGSNRTLKVNGNTVSKTGNNTLEQVEHAEKYTRGIWKIELAEDQSNLNEYSAMLPELTGKEITPATQLAVHSHDLLPDGTYQVSQLALLRCVAIDSLGETHPLDITLISGSDYSVNLSDLPMPLTLYPLYI